MLLLESWLKTQSPPVPDAFCGQRVSPQPWGQLSEVPVGKDSCCQSVVWREGFGLALGTAAALGPVDPPSPWPFSPPLGPPTAAAGSAHHPDSEQGSLGISHLEGNPQPAGDGHCEPIPQLPTAPCWTVLRCAPHGPSEGPQRE